jgi:hypothetical protein
MLFRCEHLLLKNTSKEIIFLNLKKFKLLVFNLDLVFIKHLEKDLNVKITTQKKICEHYKNKTNSP